MNMETKENNMQQGKGSAGLVGQSKETFCWPFVKKSARYSAIFVVFMVLLVGALVYTRLLDTTTFVGGLTPMLSTRTGGEPPKKARQQIEIPVNCTELRLRGTCPTNYPTTFEEDPDSNLNNTCPEYFRWIHEDLRPWAYTGITLDMVERAKKTANFRLVIVNGRAYVEKYHGAFQTRDVFTLWGILQLLRKYPGKVPDLDLRFDCDHDRPVIKSSDYGGPNPTSPPPLFRYCRDEETLDIVFPDWSFWGWPEIHIKSWVPLLKELMEGNQRKRWEDRESHAYWKGNPYVGENRQDLMKCNVSHKQDWGALLYAQDWERETRQGFKKSNLADQCVNRFKIYVEGWGWSVSQKYILACDSMTLLVKPRYFDFSTRSLEPLHHYWPIKVDDKCRSIKHAVDWGNSHKKKAKAIGKAASEFIKEELKMDYVYDYMFHLLNEYAKLLRYKPTIPTNAVIYCLETMACPVEGLVKEYMMESMVNSPSLRSPCTMPPPYDPASLRGMLKRKENSIKQVEEWEKKFWEKHK